MHNTTPLVEVGVASSVRVAEWRKAVFPDLGDELARLKDLLPEVGACIREIFRLLRDARRLDYLVQGDFKVLQILEQLLALSGDTGRIAIRFQGPATG